MKYLLGHDSSKDHFKLAPGFQTAYHETTSANALIALFAGCIISFSLEGCIIGEASFWGFSKSLAVASREIFGIIETYFVGNLGDVAVVWIVDEYLFGHIQTIVA